MTRSANLRWTFLGFFCTVLCPGSAAEEDQPQWGQRHTRNMVSGETGLPDGFDPGKRDPQTGDIDLSTTKNVKWVARLGKQTYGSPVVAGGKVYVGTNNDVPRDPRIGGDRGVLMCFDETSGEFLWQLVVPKLYEVKNADWHYIGLTSPPTVENGRVYLISNRGEVMCLDPEGMANGNQGPYTDEARHMTPAGQQPLETTAKDGDIIWLYDMIGELGVRPHNATNCSILIHGDVLYVCTSNGVEHTHNRVANPEAPTAIAVNKNTGKLIARDDFGIGADIIHGQWSSPALGQVGDKTCVFLGTGNGHVYAFEAVDPAASGGKPGVLKNVWKFNGHPLAQTQDSVPIEHGFHTRSYEVVAMPVFHKNRIYVPITQDFWHNQRLGWLTCIDATGTGDVTRGGLLWSYDKTGACISTVSVADGLVYVADWAGGLHCLDAQTGEPYWVHAAGGPIWGCTLVADGKIYLGTGRLSLWILAAGKELKVLGEIRMRDRIYSTPVAANGVLYIATTRHLYAVGP